MKKNQFNHLILFDGSCGLCSTAVRLILKIDQDQKFMFAPLNGKTAANFVDQSFLKSINSLVLVENFESVPQIYVKSEAVFKVIAKCKGIVKFLLIFKLLPSFILDWLYDKVAKNRHKFLATKCLLPSEKLNSRFLP